MTRKWPIKPNRSTSRACGDVTSSNSPTKTLQSSHATGGPFPVTTYTICIARYYIKIVPGLNLSQYMN
jgi:hypothetical protein